MESDHTAPPAWITHLRSRNFTTPVRPPPSHTALLHLYLRHFILSARRSPAHDNTRPSLPGPRNPRMPALIETRSATPVRRPWLWELCELPRDRCGRPKSSELFGPGLPGSYREGKCTSLPAVQSSNQSQARVPSYSSGIPKFWRVIFVDLHVAQRFSPDARSQKCLICHIDGESPTLPTPDQCRGCRRDVNRTNPCLDLLCCSRPEDQRQVRNRARFEAIEILPR